MTDALNTPSTEGHRMTIEFKLVQFDRLTVDFAALFQATSKLWLHQEYVATEDLCRV